VEPIPPVSGAKGLLRQAAAGIKKIMNTYKKVFCISMKRNFPAGNITAICPEALLLL
jgi:hypothetical protein